VHIEKKFIISFYYLCITILIVLSALGKLLHPATRGTILLSSILLLFFIFLTYILLKYAPNVNVFLWSSLLLIIANLSVQFTGSISHSMFLPLYFFLIAMVALKSKRSVVLLLMILIIILEFLSALFKHSISLHLVITILILTLFSIFISYFIDKIKKDKNEIEKKLRDIEKSTSVLTTPVSMNNSNEVLTTLKNRKGKFDIRAREKMAEFIEPILNALFQTIDSHSSVIFLKEESKNSFFLFLSKSHSAYINKNGVISQKTGIYSWVIKEKEPLLNNQFLLDSTLLEYYSRDENIRSILIMPLLEERNLIGLLICDSKEENKFDWQVKEKIKVFGNLCISVLSLFKSLYWAKWGANHYAALHEIAKRLSQSLEPNRVLDIVTEIAPQGFDFDLLVLILCEKKERPTIYRTFPEDKFPELKGNEISLKGSLTGLVIQKNQMLIKSRRIKTPFFNEKEKGLEEFHSFIGVPLHKDEKVSGELALMSINPSQFTSEKKEPIIFLANLISVALEKAKLYQETKALSITDGLTGAFNHKHFQECLIKELNRARRIGTPFSLIMFDIDHFKNFNDNFGHQTGDMVLKHISETVMKNVRKIDIFARYGGEEFIIILPDVAKDGVIAVGEKLRMFIEKKPLIVNENIYPVTISVGCATFPFDGEDKDTLIQKVDKALYTAKQDGRNCVRTAM